MTHKTPKLLANPMTEKDFQQMTLLANAIAIIQIIIKKEKPGPRRTDYADIMKRLKRVEHSIPGHLEGRSIKESEEFYLDLEKAVNKFLATFEKAE